MRTLYSTFCHLFGYFRWDAFFFHISNMNNALKIPTNRLPSVKRRAFDVLSISTSYLSRVIVRRIRLPGQSSVSVNGYNSEILDALIGPKLLRMREKESLPCSSSLTDRVQGTIILIAFHYLMGATATTITTLAFTTLTLSSCNSPSLAVCSLVCDESRIIRRRSARCVLVRHGFDGCIVFADLHLFPLQTKG